MRPRVLDTAGRELAPALTVLLIPKEPEESTAFFRFQVMKTPDPRDVYEHALAYLQADYFQTESESFRDRLVTRASRQSSLAASPASLSSTSRSGKEPADQAIAARCTASGDRL